MGGPGGERVYITGSISSLISSGGKCSVKRAAQRGGDGTSECQIPGI